MSDWKPGTVAKATVRGVPDVLVFRRSTFSGGMDWAHGSLGTGFTCTNDDEVTDVRPLVVLDLDGIVDPAGALRLIANEDVVDAKRSLLLGLADQIEAQTKPPRIPEPGLWAVVEAWHPQWPTRRYVHHEEGWWVNDRGALVTWDDLIEPVLVREGVTA